MGKAHAIALRSVATVFPDVRAPELRYLVDSEPAIASELARAWGFESSTDNWRVVCEDPSVDVVDICTPNHLHKEMSLAAISAGKHVYCEKPLALTSIEAREIAAAANDAGVRTSMGFNYICNPVIELARQLISAGEIGEIYNFRGGYQEDYLQDPMTPFSWRCLRTQGGHGALADLGTHVINMAEFLLGPISDVCGTLSTVHERRPDPSTGELRTVENEDIAQVLMRFSRGYTGTMEISRIATGRKCGLTFEITGSRGCIAFDQERMNEIRLFSTSDNIQTAGFRTILAGPQHPDYAAFCPAAGHGLGINDLKVIEIRNLLRSIDTGESVYADFDHGCRVQELTDAIALSSSEGGWVPAAPATQLPSRDDNDNSHH